MSHATRRVLPSQEERGGEERGLGMKLRSQRERERESRGGEGEGGHNKKRSGSRAAKGFSYTSIKPSAKINGS